MGDPQLRAHLGGGAGGIHTVENALPKTEPHGEQWIVRNISLVILCLNADFGRF